jgi:hypothetical protein
MIKPKGGLIVVSDSLLDELMEALKTKPSDDE